MTDPALVIKGGRLVDATGVRSGDVLVGDDGSILAVGPDLDDVLQGKAGLGGKNKKDAGDHKVRLCMYAHRRDLISTSVLVDAACDPVQCARIFISAGSRLMIA